MIYVLEQSTLRYNVLNVVKDESIIIDENDWNEMSSVQQLLES